MIRLNLANLLIFKAFLVLAALGVLIVVDSSIARSVLFLCKKCVAYFIPTDPLSASMFINTIRSLLFGCTISFKFCLSFFVISLGAFQVATVYGTSSDKCVGISPLSQLRYTPLGAMIIALSIFFSK